MNLQKLTKIFFTIVTATGWFNCWQPNGERKEFYVRKKSKKNTRELFFIKKHNFILLSAALIQSSQQLFIEKFSR